MSRVLDVEFRAEFERADKYKIIVTTNSGRCYYTTFEGAANELPSKDEVKKNFREHGAKRWTPWNGMVMR